MSPTQIKPLQSHFDENDGCCHVSEKQFDRQNNHHT